MDPLRALGQPSARFAGDEGAADPVTRLLMSTITDHTSYIRALVALCTTRLLMPIVATGDEGDAPDGDRHAEMAAVTLEEEGETHLLAFTGLDSLQAWQQDARPIPCLLDELSQSAAQVGATRILIDAAGPTPLVIAGEALQQFAAGFALVEFEGGEFSWVKYAEEDAAPAPDGQPSPSSG